MIIKKLGLGIEVDDDEFDAIYPRQLKAIAEIHFTPVKVAQAASRFLADKPNARVLDIGSGAGKFCLVGAACSKGRFTGVEQRKSLHRLAQRLAKHYNVQNVDLILSNIVDIDFEAFDAVYCFNAFYENIFQDSAIDTSVVLDRKLYDQYTQYVREQLSKMPVGTRLVTYFSFMDEVPTSYQIQFTDFDEKLKMWEKVV